MGKGDRKTARGKRYNSSYGNVRSHNAMKASSGTAGSTATKKTVVKVAKKTVAKKTTA